MTDRHTDRLTDRERERDRDTEKEKQTDRQTDRERTTPESKQILLTRACEARGSKVDSQTARQTGAGQQQKQAATERCYYVVHTVQKATKGNT